MLTQKELLKLKRRCLEVTTGVAPLECEEDAILKAAQLAFETLLEGTPGPDGGYVEDVCPTCGQIGAVQANGFKTCMSCDERWKP
tara:strand:+ start:782 stop:1036 length:255 start_codon:yes stop_codon:yes gene_type:complete